MDLAPIKENTTFALIVPIEQNDLALMWLLQTWQSFNLVTPLLQTSFIVTQWNQKTHLHKFWL
jgi:hypothetical protein